MPKKTKIPPCKITSREGLDATIADILRLENEYEKLTASLEEEIITLKKLREAAIVAIAREHEVKKAGAEVYCQIHRLELFQTKKSLPTICGSCGFELNPPSLKKKREKDKWSDVAFRLNSLDWGQDYVTDPEPEVAKAKILADRDKLTKTQLDSVGVEIVQEEQFFVRPHGSKTDIQQAA